MFNLSTYLEKFKVILATPAALKKPVIKSIQDHTGIELTEKELEIKDDIIYLKTSSLAKNEIFMKKSLVLKDLQALLGSKAPTKIQ